MSEQERATVLARELRVIAGKLIRRLREQTRLGDLTWSQVSVVGRLERDGPATVTTLARAEGIRPQSMGAIIAALQTSGLVQGAPDPNDGRQTILSITDACRAWIEAGRSAREDWLYHEILTKFTPEETDTVASAVELLNRLVGS